ncbi:MAG: hypothetical protein QG622_1870 [Actinomycetota bacterium]|nr:hypothetical protein [Actinomycetota bacterium]
MPRMWGHRSHHRSSPPGTRPLLDESLGDLVAEVTSGIIQQIAPAERALFAAHRDTFLAHPGVQPGVQPDEGKESPLGFGGDLGHLLTPEIVLATSIAVNAVLTLLTEAVRDAAKDAIAEPLTAGVRRVFRHREPRPPDESRPPADPGLTQCVRAALRAHFAARGLPESEVKIITDALVQRLLPPDPDPSQADDGNRR